MSIIVSTHSTAPIGLTVSDQDILVAQHGSITTNGSTAIFTTGAGHSLTTSVIGHIASNLTALQLNGVESGTNNNDSQVTVGPAGSITSSSGIAIDSIGNGVDIFNAGFISGKAKAIALDGASHNLLNSGTIVGTGYAILFDQSGNPGQSEFGNSGTLLGGVHVVDGSINFNNSGTLHSRLTAVHYETSTGGKLTLSNTGTIAAEGSFAIYMTEPSPGGAVARIVNAGDMTGSIQTAASNDRLENTGLINGFVKLGDGNDIVINRGTITGDSDQSNGIDLGDGNDFYRGTGTVTGLIEGNGGDDTFHIRADGLDLDGGSGNDTLHAWRDIDSALNFETVRLRGRSDLGASLDGTDSLLTGNRGDNYLNAGAGDDTVKGFDGDDVLLGGDGKDDLTGGRGADTFVYSAISHSGATTATRDRIIDFARGKDVIDLEELVVGKIEWIGTAKFSATGSAEARYRALASAVVVFTDTDGDGVADSSIRVQDLTQLDASDFIL